MSGKVAIFGTTPIVGCDFFEKDCGVQKSQLLWQLTTADGLECRGR